MGETRIRGLDEALLHEPRAQASLHGVDPEVYARGLPTQPAALLRVRRATMAKKILTSQPRKAKTESVVFIRDNRASR